MNSGTSSLVHVTRPRNVGRAGLGNGRGAATQPSHSGDTPATGHGGAGGQFEPSAPISPRGPEEAFVHAKAPFVGTLVRTEGPTREAQGGLPLPAATCANRSVPTEAPQWEQV